MRSTRPIFAAALLLPVLWLAPRPAWAGGQELVEPPALKSHDGRLDILMVARQQRLNTLPGRPIGWVYEACNRKGLPKDAKRCRTADIRAGDLNRCPEPDDPQVSPYGGVRLQLHRTDRLRIRLVNCLPPIAKMPHPEDFKHATGDTLLQSNPTNLHTHGLIVEPRCADHVGGSYGDYIFVLAMQDPPAPVAECGHGISGHPSDHAKHWDITPDGTIQYDIFLKNHPSGLFWFHPHAHGLALAQVTGGLAGIISVGTPSDYLCDDVRCRRSADKWPTRHLVLKDTQVRPDGTLLMQEDPKFCGLPDLSVSAPLGKGFCPGVNGPADGGQYQGGNWFFTVNGQVDPEITIDPKGEVWRIANTSGSATYWTGLQDEGSGKDLIFQVLSIDGITFQTDANTEPMAVQNRFANKLRMVDCPVANGSNWSSKPICASRILMMPSSRVELWVNAPGATSAVLRTYSFDTGTRGTDNSGAVADSGDTWPGVELAHVSFPKPSLEARAVASATAMNVRGEAPAVLGPGGVLGSPATTKVEGVDLPVPVADLARRASAKNGTAEQEAYSARLATLAAPAQQDDCRRGLPVGKARQIVFGLPGTNKDTDKFGIGYRIVDRNGALTPPESMDITEFDHAARPTVCLLLEAGDNKVVEQWELVNIAGEDHNFHIHQTRFGVEAVQQPGETGIPFESSPPNSRQRAVTVLHDNVPLPHGEGCDGIFATWRSGKCKPSRVIVEITFSQVGDFVFHCHILEHEDGGMMAKISVVPNSQR